MNLSKLPTDIYRIIYRQWYFPFVLQELLRCVPQDNRYLVAQLSNESETVDFTMIRFFSKNGTPMSVISQTRTVNRLNRKDKLIDTIGRRC